GQTLHLWLFNNYIYCKDCFEDQFCQEPEGEPSHKAKILLRDILPELGEAPYSDYVDYVKENYTLEAEYHMLDYKNYVRGRKLLSSPKLRTISKNLTKKQNKRLYVLSKFFCQLLIDKCDGKNCPSFGEYMYLLVSKNEG